MSLIRQRTCEAPSCPRDAVYIAKGIDTFVGDGEEFEDAVCQSCADYLSECSAQLDVPLELTRLERLA
jgi:hypothetical protein